MISAEWAILFPMTPEFLNLYITKEAWLHMMLFGCGVTGMWVGCGEFF